MSEGTAIEKLIRPELAALGAYSAHTSPDMLAGMPAERIIKLDDEQEISTVRLGVNILRYVFKAFCRHMQYLNLKKLDKLLVTRE